MVHRLYGHCSVQWTNYSQSRTIATCLDVLGDPPVVLGLEVADGDESVAGADGELVLLGRPAHARRRAVDAQQHQRVPPLAVGLQ